MKLGSSNPGSPLRDEWILPLCCSSQLSPYSLTLVSGLLAVVSVNIVIAFYIYMAMKEPSDKHEPDPSFLANAKASVNQFAVDTSTSSQSSKKQE
ncbi:hypothetical protein FNV43_RR02442 [Rhamnella rubrinervis]|uniref:Vacuolar ATPase assembly integral membrane protein VMA21 homolog n=1 Tax=Rhamnella rubrinervis TaxID=2594499 RepID=A0A8K0HTM7_9ROSA|nr:hypothetical protein FNV43_RR02442 [Rhamnella rubrinervis]